MRHRGHHAAAVSCWSWKRRSCSAGTLIARCEQRPARYTFAMRTWVFAAVLTAATSAAATPLEPLWDVPYGGSCDSAVFRLDGQLALVRDRTLQPLDTATGKLGKQRKLRGREKNVQHGS